MDQHTGGKWLIHDTKRRKNNQLQSLELPPKMAKLLQTEIDFDSCFTKCMVNLLEYW